MIGTISLVSLAVVLQSPAAGIASEKPLEINVGIVAFEDFRAESEQSEKLLAELAASHDAPLHFKLAVGTYGDVAHWLKAGLIDVAVVTPGLFAGMSGDETVGAQTRYLTTVGKPAAVSAWAGDDRKRPGSHDHYRAVCAVAASSPLKSADDLRKAAGRGNVRFVCVHPMSVSSRIAPAFALRQMGIDLGEGQIEYTYSHSASLRRLTEAATGALERVAFVWDDALRSVPELADKVRAVTFPELDGLEIPSDAVVARAGFERSALVERLLLAHADAAGHPDFLRPQNWQRQYESVRRWGAAAGIIELSDRQQISIDEIGRLLVRHARSQPAPPRLALVLSGGGAKCAYQVGAVRALEEQLAELRQENPGQPFDISLVVGTSGGAINALPIALGITRTPEGRDDFLNVWSRLDQRKIVRPALVVRGNIGLWFALLQTAVVLWIMRRWVKEPRHRAWVFGGLFAVLAAIEIVIRYLDIAPWSWLGGNHWLHHAWLWMSFGIGASAWSVLAVGLAVLARQWMLVRRGSHLAISTRSATSILAAGLLGLPFVQVVAVLFYQNTLSGGEGMEEALTQHIPGLIDRQLERSRL